MPRYHLFSHATLSDICPGLLSLVLLESHGIQFDLIVDIISIDFFGLVYDGKFLEKIDVFQPSFSFILDQLFSN